jgi:hypothetical protein
MGEAASVEAQLEYLAAQVRVWFAYHASTRRFSHGGNQSHSITFVVVNLNRAGDGVSFAPRIRRLEPEMF